MNNIHNSSMDFVHNIKFVFLQLIIFDEITDTFLNLRHSTSNKIQTNVNKYWLEIFID